MRILDLEKDRDFYDNRHRSPGPYKKDALDLWRFYLLKRILKKISGEDEPFKDKSVLNVAGGWGREAYLMLNEDVRHLTILDYSHTQSLYAKKYLERFSNKSIICGNGEKLPFKDKSVDICVIAEGLHHFSQPLKGIEEMSRVARRVVVLDEPGGGLFRKAVNRLLIFMGIKEELERGYLQEYRINRKDLEEIGETHGDIVSFSYFIYYFGWYKRAGSMVIKKTYQILLAIFNVFFHYLGNRTILAIKMDK